jgi:hypothetical protein
MWCRSTKQRRAAERRRRAGLTWIGNWYTGEGSFVRIPSVIIGTGLPQWKPYAVPLVAIMEEAYKRLKAEGNEPTYVRPIEYQD